MHIFEHGNQKHNFILEFEKIPDNITDFDIIESESVGSNFYGVKIAKLENDTSFIDISEFLKLTPAKEFGYYFKDGQPVFYYKHRGLIIAVLLEYEQQYGKYYKANIVVKNLTGKDILLDPSQITAKYQNKGIVKDALVLNYNHYMARVNNTQSWSAFAKVLGESLGSINAGYTYETTYSNKTFNSNTYGNLDGSYNNMNFNISGNSYTYSTNTTRTRTQTFNSNEQKNTIEKSQQNIQNFMLEQHSIKRQISDGYLRLNTIVHSAEYIGYIYIEYKKNDTFQLHIPIKGTTYSFDWVW